MRLSIKRVLLIGAAVATVIAAIPIAVWLSLTHQPSFYRAMVIVPHAQQEEKAKRFVAQSLQLRNDICNEPAWEAVFSDQEVNAWLAEDLVTHFADQLPPEVHEPRVVFDVDRVTFAFELDHGPVRSVIWVVARPNVPEGNVLELTFEKIRAGMIPVPADQVFERIVDHARNRGIDVSWRRAGVFPVATLRYTPDTHRADVTLERVQIRKGEIRLVGRSDQTRGKISSPTLPTRRVLQSKFPKRNVHDKEDVSLGPPPDPVPIARSSTNPTS